MHTIVYTPVPCLHDATFMAFHVFAQKDIGHARQFCGCQAPSEHTQTLPRNTCSASEEQYLSECWPHGACPCLVLGTNGRRSRSLRWEVCGTALRLEGVLEGVASTLSCPLAHRLEFPSRLLSSPICRPLCPVSQGGLPSRPLACVVGSAELSWHQALGHIPARPVQSSSLSAAMIPPAPGPRTALPCCLSGPSPLELWGLLGFSTHLSLLVCHLMAVKLSWRMLPGTGLIP